jgi:HAE1 family hydrophobic/amphiphilic exporter-1
VQVSAQYVGADAQSVEQGVTSVLEQQINGVENMEFISSTSTADGASRITVSFASGSDGDINQVNVQNRVARAQARLPEAVRQTGVTVNKASTSILLVYTFTSEDPNNPYSLETISSLLDQNLTDAIRRVPGVGDLSYFGNRELAYRLWLDPAKLTANNLTASDVTAALRSQNRLVPAGQIGAAPSPDNQAYTLTVQLQGRVRSVAEFENLILRSSADGGLVRLKDVGRVTLGGESYAVDRGLDPRRDQGPAGSRGAGGADPVSVPAGLEGHPGAGDCHPGVAGGHLPVREDLRLRAHQLTLFGLVLATGLVVDDAITVIEDTVNKHRQGLGALQAAKATMDELFGAVVATFLVLLAVFVPVLFFPGATGTIYRQFAATIIFSMAISTFNALTFSPMLAALLLAREDAPPSRRTYAIAGACIGFVYGIFESETGVLAALAALISGALLGFVLTTITGRPLRLACTAGGAGVALLFAGLHSPLLTLLFAVAGGGGGWGAPWIFAHFNRIYAAAERRYHGLLEWGFSHRKLVLAGLGGGILFTAIAFTSIPTGFVPTEDQGFAIGIVQTPEGSSLQVTAAIQKRVAAILREEPEIQTSALFSGASFDGNAPNRGLFFFGTSNWSERRSPDQSVAAIVARLNRKLSQIQEARVIVIEPPAIRGYGNSGGFEFQLLDQSGGAVTPGQFFEAAGAMIGQANGSGDFSRVFTQFSPESPQLRLEVNRDRMAALQVDYEKAMDAVSLNIGGSYINDTFTGGKVRRVYVQADERFRATPEALQKLTVENAAGKPIALAEFMRVEPVTGPSVIPRFNLYRSIKIEGVAAPGRSSGDAIQVMQGLFQRLNVNGLGYDWTGISREEIKAGALAVVIFALGILVVYLVLAGQYESYTDPLVILMTVPTAMLGALLFLSLRGEVLNIYAQVGLVMLIGLAAKNGILIVDLANQRLEEGATVLEAARSAAQVRLRPILMTAIASLAGFLPLVLASGAGARSQASLGTVVFGGLTVATVLSLLVVPVFYVAMKQLSGVTTRLSARDMGTELPSGDLQP